MTARAERGIPSSQEDTLVLPKVAGDPAGAGIATSDAHASDAHAADPPAADPLASDAGSVARNSATMALGSIVSRLTGFVRTAAIGAAIGAAAVADDYNIANTLPNMVYELLLGGILASVVVPVLVRARRTESDGGEAYAQRLLTLTVVFFGAATVVAVACAPLLAAIMVRHAEDRALTTTLAYLLLPEIFFYGVAAVLAALLNVRGHFAAPMWTPILNNIVVIATAGLFIAVPHIQPVTPDSITTGHVLILGIGTTLGIAVQAAGLWPALRRAGFRWRWRWDFRALRLRELGRLGSWMLVYVAVSQVGVLVVLKIAKLAAEEAAGGKGVAGPAIFNNAFLMFMMAHGIVAVSIITALLPRMSAAAADGRMSDLASQLSLGTRLSAVILMPAAAAYLVLGQPLAVTLFQFGEYNHQRALDTAPVIAVAGIALVPYAISQLQTFAFYALADTKLPALINIPVVALRIAIDAALYLWLLPATWMAAGLMGGGAVSFVAAVALGYWVLRRRVGRLDLTRVLDTLLRLAAAAAIAAIVAGGVEWLLDRLLGDDKVASMIQLVVAGSVLVAGYVAAALLLRVREISEVAAMLRSRLRRS